MGTTGAIHIKTTHGIRDNVIRLSSYQYNKCIKTISTMRNGRYGAINSTLYKIWYVKLARGGMIPGFKCYANSQQQANGALSLPLTIAEKM